MNFLKTKINKIQLSPIFIAAAFAAIIVILIVLQNRVRDNQNNFDGYFKGLGNAYVVNNNSTTLTPFTSSYSYIYSMDGSIQNTNFSTIFYKNSLIGEITLSAAVAPKYNSNSIYQEVASDGSLNFVNIFFYDAHLDMIFVIITITGTYNNDKYSSIDLQYRLPESPSVNVSEVKKKNSSKEFHNILDENENIMNMYLQIKSKLNK
jgi:Ca2+-binding RTX toxin-like protein